MLRHFESSFGNFDEKILALCLKIISFIIYNQLIIMKNGLLGMRYD